MLTKLPIAAVAIAVCLLVAGCQTSGAGPDRDDGYFTWVDEQGRVRQTIIPRKSLEEAVSDTAAWETVSSEPVTSTRSDPEYNLENYPDGNELEKAGFIRPGDPMPYFTWLDAAGNVRVSYFTPDTRTDIEKGLIRPPVRLTPASTYQPDEVGQDALARTANPETLAILGVEQEGQSWFQRWTEACCVQLRTAEPQAWVAGREFPVRIASDAETHQFSTGISAYQLVRLPLATTHRDLVVRLRSFAEGGALFVPSVAFLNSEMQPVRVVTDMAHEFSPESWHRRAYLQAFLPVFPEHGEHWMLIFTRRQDLQGQTVTEEQRRPVVYQHANSGLLSLQRVHVD